MLLLRSLADSLGEGSLLETLVPWLPARDLMVGLAVVAHYWADLLMATRNDVAVWRERCEQMWALPSPGSVSVSLAIRDHRPAAGWREAFRMLAREAFQWDKTVARDELTYGESEDDRIEPTAPDPAAVTCRKCNSFPDVSYAFGRGGFTGGIVRWSVRVRAMSDELRIGVTDDRFALEEGWEFSFHKPHLWCYSDGSTVNGIHARGKRWVPPSGPPTLPTWGVGDVVGVELNFQRRTLAFSVNGSHVCSLCDEHFPQTSRPLFPVVVLDAAGDRVEFHPGTRGHGQQVARPPALPFAGGGGASATTAASEEAPFLEASLWWPDSSAEDSSS